MRHLGLQDRKGGQRASLLARHPQRRRQRARCRGRLVPEQLPRRVQRSRRQRRGHLRNIWRRQRATHVLLLLDVLHLLDLVALWDLLLHLLDTLLLL